MDIREYIIPSWRGKGLHAVVKERNEWNNVNIYTKIVFLICRGTPNSTFALKCGATDLILTSVASWLLYSIDSITYFLDDLLSVLEIYRFKITWPQSQLHNFVRILPSCGAVIHPGHMISGHGRTWPSWVIFLEFLFFYTATTFIGREISPK